MTEIVKWNGDEIEIPEPFEFESVQEIMSYLENTIWKDQTNPSYQQISPRILQNPKHNRVDLIETESKSDKVSLNNINVEF